MNSEPLHYSDDGFPAVAAKLIGDGQTFSFEVTGEAYRELVPHLEGGRIVDPIQLGLRPKLRTLLALLMLAEGQGQSVTLELGEERLRFYVGGGRGGAKAR
jgi:hypothetical protein